MTSLKTGGENRVLSIPAYFLTIVAGLCYTPLTAAQSNGSEASAIEEVVVTAQKREQALGDVAQSI